MIGWTATRRLQIAMMTGAAVSALVAGPAIAQEEIPASPEADEVGPEIVVTGIRASLASAINEKRASDTIIDVINAQDVGKLPDQNLAEVLENVSGVQIDRSQGVGSNVSIRGSNQNLVLINGRATTPSGDARGGISFDDLPAELIASVSVTKVATADQIEGSVGGIVDLRTYRGLGLRKPIASIRADMEYAENADAYNPRVSAVFGRTFDTGIGDIGVVLSGAYGEQSVREDVLNVRYAARTGVDLDGDGVSDPYLRPNYAQQFFSTRDRRNASISGSAEWQAASNLKLFVDGTYVNQRIVGNEAGVFIQQPADVAELAFPADRVIEKRDASGFSYNQLVSGRIGGTQFRPQNNSPLRKTRSYLAAGGAEWEFGQFLIKAEASRAGSNTTDANFQLVSQYNDPASANFGNANGRISPPFLFDITGDDLFFAPDPASPLFANIGNPAYYQTFIGRDNANYFLNVENAQRVDAEWKADIGPIRSIQLGARFNQTDSRRRRTTQASRQFPGITAASRPDLYSIAPSDFFDFTGDQYLGGFIVPSGLLTRDPAGVREALGLAAVPPEDLTARFRVKENSYAGYLRVNLDTNIGSVGLRGNAGVRLVHTSQTASGIALANGLASDVDVRQNYTYWLPNAALTAEPVKSVLLRASYGRSLRRPDFGQLSPTVQFPLLDVYVSAGNPNLKPQTVDQYDAAVEWYFDRNSLLSIGGFYKKYQNLVTTVAVAPTLIDPARGPFDPTNCATGIFNPVSIDQSGAVGECVGINQPVNAGSATLKGLEVSFQQSFTYLPGALDGLGVIANYTYQDGKRETTFTVPGFATGGVAGQFALPLRDLSKNNYNLTLFYEKYGINARVRYTFRDPFLRVEAVDLTNNLPLYQDERSQLNASVSVDINPQFAITFSGVNLTNQPNRERAIFVDGPIGQERIADRRYAVGVRGKF
jgi:iron complex outermembrane receptor protein